MQALIITMMNKFGYLGILLLIALENIFPPIPSEVILGFGGFMTTYTNLNIIGIIIFSTLGSIIGAVILYYIGSILNKERLSRIVNGKIGKILFLKEKDIEKAYVWFDKKGYATVFFCRFVPIVRSLISIPAGMSEMKIFNFSILTLIGSFIWNSVLVIVGSLLGENWEKLAIIMDEFSTIVLILIIILFIVGLFIFYKNKIKKKQVNSK